MTMICKNCHMKITETSFCSSRNYWISNEESLSEKYYDKEPYWDACPGSVEFLKKYPTFHEAMEIPGYKDSNGCYPHHEPLDHLAMLVLGLEDDASE